MIRVVLDANVLVSAAIARDAASPSVRAFDALVDERIEAIATPTLLAEVASVLERERLRRFLTLDEARRFITDLAGLVTLVADPPGPHPAVSRDPDDDYLVALATAVEADALVTGDFDLLEVTDVEIALITRANSSNGSIRPEAAGRRWGGLENRCGGILRPRV